MLTGQRVVVTGGTGSLGKCLVRRLLAGEMGDVSSVVVFSRDEAKQHAMRLESQGWGAVTDDVVYGDKERKLQFIVGDVRDYQAVKVALRGASTVIHAAAMKQVLPSILSMKPTISVSCRSVTTFSRSRG